MVTHVYDIADPRLDAYARLTDVQLRNRLEPERGLLIAESAKVIERAMDAGLRATSLLVGEDQLEHEMPLIARFEALYPNEPVLVAPNAQLKQLTGFALTRGALAAFRRPMLPDAHELLERIAHETFSEPRLRMNEPSSWDTMAAASSDDGNVCPKGASASRLRVAILEDITNHTNVGAIFRSAAALGVDAVLVTPGCYDPFYRRAVRVSMGAVFQVPWTYIGQDVEGTGAHGNAERAGGWTRTGVPLLHGAGFKIAAMTLDDESVPLDDPALNAEERLAIVLGTEGEGLSPATIAAADYTVRIPMQHGVDSLNVAAASAVAFWQLR